nr:MAG TPA: hypothetical protein [Caudoviricetes sp.]
MVGSETFIAFETSSCVRPALTLAAFSVIFSLKITTSLLYIS